MPPGVTTLVPRVASVAPEHAPGRAIERPHLGGGADDEAVAAEVRRAEVDPRDDGAPARGVAQARRGEVRKARARHWAPKAGARRASRAPRRRRGRARGVGLTLESDWLASRSASVDSRSVRRRAPRRRLADCERSRRRIARTSERPKASAASSTSATPSAGKVCTVRRGPPVRGAEGQRQLAVGRHAHADEEPEASPRRAGRGRAPRRRRRGARARRGARPRGRVALAEVDRRARGSRRAPGRGREARACPSARRSRRVDSSRVPPPVPRRARGSRTRRRRRAARRARARRPRARVGDARRRSPSARGLIARELLERRGELDAAMTGASMRGPGAASSVAEEPLDRGAGRARRPRRTARRGRRRRPAARGRRGTR